MEYPDFTDKDHGSLPIGTATAHGVITAKSLTAYLMDGETWVSWTTVHGPRAWAQPLVSLNWSV